MDSPVHFGTKRMANPDSPINLPGAYFVTLKISLQNFGKSWGRGGNWRNTVKINLFLSFPRFTALPRVLRQGVKGVKRVKWGFPDIWEVKSVSRWQSYTTNETLLMDFHRSEMELGTKDGGSSGLFDIATRSLIVDAAVTVTRLHFPIALVKVAIKQRSCQSGSPTHFNCGSGNLTKVLLPFRQSIQNWITPDMLFLFCLHEENFTYFFFYMKHFHQHVSTDM